MTVDIAEQPLLSAPPSRLRSTCSLEGPNILFPTRPQAERFGVRISAGLRNFFLFRNIQTVLRLSQSPIQWIKEGGLKWPEGEVEHSPPFGSEVKDLCYAPTNL